MLASSSGDFRDVYIDPSKHIADDEHAFAITNFQQLPPLASPALPLPVGTDGASVLAK